MINWKGFTNKEKNIRIKPFSVAIASMAIVTLGHVGKVRAEEVSSTVGDTATLTAKPIEYEVVKGDYLDKIGREKGTTWQRLYNKNLTVEHPDRIDVGEKLIIPTPEEVLADRLAPAAPVAPVQAPKPVQTASKPLQTPQQQKVLQRAPVRGNTYTPGQCTWYVKNRRPDLPNNLGNANTWYSRARAQGIPTGTVARAGAAAQRKTGMHVVYVEAVHGNGKITISEMNYNYVPYSKRTRVANASDFLYIY